MLRWMQIIRARRCCGSLILRTSKEENSQSLYSRSNRGKKELRISTVPTGLAQVDPENLSGRSSRKCSGQINVSCIMQDGIDIA